MRIEFAFVRVVEPVCSKILCNHEYKELQMVAIWYTEAELQK